MKPKAMKLAGCIERAYVVAYQEDTSLLEKALEEEGFSVRMIRASYSEEELTYSRTFRCLLGHRSAWARCAGREGLSMVVEADFVPVKGMGRLPLPFDIEKKNEAWGWLYTGGARIYELDEKNFARGHSATPVATVLGPTAARVLVDFADEEFEIHGPRKYTLWDTYVRMYAQKRGIMSYMPYRCYGEHGGIPNPEHAIAGTNPVHRAGVLWRPLHFLPMYARKSYSRFVFFRALAKLKGIAQLLTGRYVELAILRNNRIKSKDKIRMLAYGAIRLCSIY